MDYIPGPDADKLQWLINASNFVSGNAEAIGVGTSRAAVFLTSVNTFSADLQNHETAQAAARAATATKDLSADNSVAIAREIAATVQGNPDVTDAMKQEMGITVRDQTKSPVPPPSVAPTTVPLDFSGFNLAVRLIDPADPTRRAKTPGVATYQLFTFVGATPPAELSGWKLAATTARASGTVPFLPADALKLAWVCARALNAKGEPGPVGEAVSVTVAAAIAA